LARMLARRVRGSACEGTNIYADGSEIEMATIGREGCTGLQAVFGAKTSSVRLLIQIPGSAAKMSRQAFTRALDAIPSFRSLMFTYVEAFIEQILVSVACNGAHSLKQRLARWLLMMRDRSDEDILPITQNLLAEMLGVQRPSITNAIRFLERGGSIGCGRGQVTILNRPRLMQASSGGHAPSMEAVLHQPEEKMTSRRHARKRSSARTREKNMQSSVAVELSSGALSSANQLFSLSRVAALASAGTATPAASAGAGSHVGRGAGDHLDRRLVLRQHLCPRKDHHESQRQEAARRHFLGWRGRSTSGLRALSLVSSRSASSAESMRPMLPVGTSAAWSVLSSWPSANVAPAPTPRMAFSPARTSEGASMITTPTNRPESR
jgi:CRP-like cAMP-binding protein